jgi:hypothetical protein
LGQAGGQRKAEGGAGGVAHMKKPEIKSAADLMRVVVERPLWAYIHFSTGWWDEIKFNARYLGDGTRYFYDGLLEALMYLCFIIYYAALIMVYPVAKAFMIWWIRRDLMPDYKKIIRRE